jgi:dipeptidyl aminopeptidase/acylaminoacyl peptidase
MTSYDLVRRSWNRCPTKVWLYDVESRGIRLLWKAPDGIGRLAWSPDEGSIAIGYAAPPVQRQSTVFWNQDIGIVTVGTGAFKVVTRAETVDDYPAWSPDSKYLGFLSIGTDSASVGMVNIDSGQREDVGGSFGHAVRQLWWDGASSRLIVEAADSGTLPRGKSALYGLSMANRTKEEISPPVGHLSGCSFGQDFTRAACILQSLMSPPDPALIEMEHPKARRLVELNPGWRHLQLGQVEERTWTNSYGAPTNGFLVKPVGYLKGKRYPLLVVLYGFEGKFVSDAEWITSYPVQSFAGAGYAVLLVNYPHAKPWSGRNFAIGSIAEGFSPLASIRRGIELLGAEGIADLDRLGILGWSYGAFLTEFALTQSDIFKAASVGNGGDYNPGVYWLLGHRAIRDRYEQVMGGPPYGASLTNWLRFSPALNAHRIRAPVLMEFSSEEALYGLEMFTALRRSRIPVELVVYPDEGHSLAQPRHRYYSMLRQLDWFDFWLQDRQGSQAPDDRLRRWRGMKHQLQSNARLGRWPRGALCVAEVCDVKP